MSPCSCAQSSQLHRARPDNLLDLGDQRRRRPHADLRDTSARTRSGRRRRFGTSSSNETRRSPRWREKISPSASNVPRLCGGIARWIATSRASRSRTLSSGSISVASDPRRLVVALELAAHEHQRAGFDRARRLARRSRERRRPRRRPRVLEREDRHPVALARLQRPARRDDAADAVSARSASAAGPQTSPRAGVGARPVRRSRRAPNSFSVVGVAIDRMAAPVEAERLLLERELLGLGPRRRVGQRDAPPAPRPSLVADAAEQLRLPLARGRAAAAPPCSHRRVDRGEQPRPQRAAGAASPSAAASESNAPALTRLSNTRLLTSRRSSVLAQRVQRVDPPLLRRARRAATRSRPRRRS